MKRKNHKGFTMIELMIVVAIVGILAAIAYPAYQEQVRQSRRADCAGELTLLANAMERWFTLNGSYPATVAAMNFPANCPIDGGTVSYTFSIPARTATTFTVQATPTGPQTSDKCGNLTLTHTGQQGVSTGLPLTECW